VVLRKALDDIALALENDEAIFIFPEGKITYDGELNEFKPGIEMINKRTPSPVYPIVLKGLWGSHFSRDKSKPVLGKLFSKITLIGGDLIESKDVSKDYLYDVTKRMLES
ncbi:1-acyl-sn-glycerol-3-phosphate acyltransferase, partial [Vibrio splendidus]